MNINRLPLVDRFQGVTYEESTSADPKAGTVELQYTDRAGRRHALKMAQLDALHLLSMLEQLARDEGLDRQHHAD